MLQRSWHSLLLDASHDPPSWELHTSFLRPASIAIAEQNQDAQEALLLLVVYFILFLIVFFSRLIFFVSPPSGTRNQFRHPWMGKPQDDLGQNPPPWLSYSAFHRGKLLAQEDLDFVQFCSIGMQVCSCEIANRGICSLALNRPLPYPGTDTNRHEQT